MRAVFFLVGLSIVEFRVIYLLHFGMLQRHLDAATGILSGHPEWVTFQSRLLGPEIAQAVAHLTHLSFSMSFRAVGAVAILTSNVVCYRLFRRVSGSPRKAITYTALYAFFVLLFQDDNWLTLWDAIDLTTMLVLPGSS